MVITQQKQHAAMRRASRQIAMFECVARPINTRTFAIPNGKYAVTIGFFNDIDLLRAQNGRSCEIFVDAGLKNNARLSHTLFSAIEGLIQPAKRRATIAGDISARCQTLGFIDAGLNKR